MSFRVCLSVRNVVFFLDSKVRWFTTWEGEENKKVEECELENINHHSAKGHLIMIHLTQGLDEIDRLSWTGLMIDLKWSKVGVHRKDVDKLQGRKYVCRSEKTLKSMSEPTWKCHYIPKYVIICAFLFQNNLIGSTATSDMRVGSQASQSSLDQKSYQLHPRYITGNFWLTAFFAPG